MARAPANRMLRSTGSEPTLRRTGFQFFREVVAQLRMVVWPTREQATRLTLLVIVISIFVGILLAVVDLAFGQLFRSLI